MHPLLLAALIGGGTGGLSAAARGTDPMKGVLTGAATGALTSGLGSMLSAGQVGAAEAAKQTGVEAAKERAIQLAKQRAIATDPASIGSLAKAATPKVMPSNFKQAMDPFGLAAKEKVGRMAYATTPSAAMAGEFLFNQPEKKKPRGPGLNMFYGRNPGNFMFGEWADPSKIEEMYEDKEDPYYYPEQNYAEGGAVEQGMNMNAIAQYAAEYLQGQGVEPTTENVQEVIEKVMEQQAQQQYQPMAGLGGQLQGMTQQYSRPMGEEVIQETETVQGMNQGGVMTPQTGSQRGSLKDFFLNMGNRGMFGGNTAVPNPSSEKRDLQDFFLNMENRDKMNQGGTPRRYYQEGGLGSMMGGMGDMMPSGDLDMRPGGEPVGPGTGTSDDIPAMLSDGEFVMTAAAVEGAGGGDRALGSERMMNMMQSFEQGGQPSPESQGLGGMEETTMTEMIGPQGMMMEEDTMIGGMA